jgi:YHS domain-containing protein
MSQVRDPVCGKTFDDAAAIGSVTYQSRVMYFCSDDCRRTFAADPDRFEPERHEPPYTVKGGVAAPKFGSAASGGLENEPTPERHHDSPGKRRK